MYNWAAIQVFLFFVVVVGRSSFTSATRQNQQRQRQRQRQSPPCVAFQSSWSSSLLWKRNPVRNLLQRHTAVNRQDAEGNDDPKIPVIGPLMNANKNKPFMIGATMWLDPPTPLQWKTIEICVDAVKIGAESSTATEMATIDAAPLVAVLQSGSKVASIAAIVGYATATTATSFSSEMNSIPQVDTFDTTSLRESLAGLSSTPFYDDTSKVRLLCVGRANLSDLTTVVFPNENENDSTVDSGLPSSMISSSDSRQIKAIENASGLAVQNDEQNLVDNEKSNLSNELDDHTTTEPILVARMQLILDTTTTTNRNTKDGGDEFGSSSSPVHALSQLSILASRINFLHQDRRKLVQGIQAVDARLEMLSHEWKDHDGIGSLFSNAEIDTGKTTSSTTEHLQTRINEMLVYTRTQMDDTQTKSDDTSTTIDPIRHAKLLQPNVSRLLELDNFGLGCIPSAYSDLPAMTKVIMELLKPYYSPEYAHMEEFEYSMFSWVAFQSIAEYLDDTRDHENAFSMANTVDRLNLVCHSMMSHKEELRSLAIAKKQELLDCGEECEIV